MKLYSDDYVQKVLYENWKKLMEDWKKESKQKKEKNYENRNWRR